VPTLLASTTIIIASPIVAKEARKIWYLNFRGTTKYKTNTDTIVIIHVITMSEGRVALMIPPPIIIARTVAKIILS